MKEWLIWSLVLALFLMIFNTTGEISGDVMKATSIISICMLIGFIYIR